MTYFKAVAYGNTSSGELEPTNGIRSLADLADWIERKVAGEGCRRYIHGSDERYFSGAIFRCTTAGIGAIPERITHYTQADGWTAEPLTTT